VRRSLKTFFIVRTILDIQEAFEERSPAGNWRVIETAAIFGILTQFFCLFKTTHNNIAATPLGGQIGSTTV
jgi:hypothetical protein